MRSGFVASLVLSVWVLLGNVLHGQSFTAAQQVFTALDQDRDGRELLTEVWYPVDDEDAFGQPPAAGFDITGEDNKLDGNSAYENEGFEFLVDVIMADLATSNNCTGNAQGGDNQESLICPGDIDLDGAVAFADFLVLAANFGKEDARWEDGDFNGDKQVSFEDFLLLANNFGKVSI